jgi:hypothetical protein
LGNPTWHRYKLRKKRRQDVKVLFKQMPEELAEIKKRSTEIEVD